MGMTHQNDSTYARLADEVAFVTPDQVLEAVTAVVTIHRDFGDRENRKHARLKYILADHGVEWFRDELQRRVSSRGNPPHPGLRAPDLLVCNSRRRHTVPRIPAKRAL